MSLIDKPPISPLDMEAEGIPAAHVAGIDMSHRAPELSDDARRMLPAPILENNPEFVDLYWRSWAIAFDKVKAGSERAGTSDHVDAAFSDNLFQWDSCFMIDFLRYATHVLPVYGTLDNFYSKQHANGFICREINGITGDDFWEDSHPSCINPPLFADAEWRMYSVTGDSERIKSVLEPLLRYYEWLERHRRANDEVGYWTTALASGMDNTPRVYEFGGGHVHKHYEHVWLCMTAQQALAAKRISQMAEAIEQSDVASTYQAKFKLLMDYVDSHMWNAEIGLYVDTGPKGQLTKVKTPAAAWPLLLGETDPTRSKAVRDNFLDRASFFRAHAIPSVSADHYVYHPHGNYWHGSVWPPMVHLAIRAMRETGHTKAARLIADNHLSNLDAVLKSTGTLWENYAADSIAPGNISRPEFAGWTACGPISSLIETIIGIDLDAPNRRVTWDLSRGDKHGVERLRLGGTSISLVFDPIQDAIYVSSDAEFELVVTRDGETSGKLMPKGRSVLDKPGRSLGGLL